MYTLGIIKEPFEDSHLFFRIRTLGRIKDAKICKTYVYFYLIFLSDEIAFSHVSVLSKCQHILSRNPKRFPLILILKRDFSACRDLFFIIIALYYNSSIFY